MNGYRNGGDAHAAGAELQRSPQERKKNQNPIEKKKSGSSLQMKIANRF
jgi:hypothetical protein